MGLFKYIKEEDALTRQSYRLLRGLFHNMSLKFGNYDIMKNSTYLLNLLSQREQGVYDNSLCNTANIFAESVNCYFGVDRLHFEGIVYHRERIVFRFKICNGSYSKIVQL